ncbi:hypothetical protein F4808DRAFT_453102 [Astrocystis sublimbata]|nr:hypothetical protein F4808DRAFT_453102 [Astrocystis sublimbata]
MNFNQPQSQSLETYREIRIYEDDSAFWPYPVPSASRLWILLIRLSPHELQVVRRHLTDLFYEDAACCLRFQIPFSHGWSNVLMMEKPEDVMQREGVGLPQFDLLNKQTAVYFVGKERNSGRHGYGYTDRRLGCYIYREWAQLYSGRPNLQRYNSCAKAFQVPHLSGSDSLDIAAVVDLHRQLCDSISAWLNEKVVFRYAPRPQGVESVFPHAVFPQADVAKTWYEHGFDMGHLFRAILLISDENVIPEPCPLQPTPTTGVDHIAIAAWLERLMPEARILMVRTGDDAHLSRPVSFASLMDSSKSGQGEGPGQLDAVRVTVPVAIRFLHELQAQEEAIYPDLRGMAARMTDDRERACREWVDSVMRHAEREDVGMDGTLDSWIAVRRMWAARDGEKFEDGQDDETHLFPLYSWTCIW